MGATPHVGAWQLQGGADSIAQARAHARDFLDGFDPRVSTADQQNVLLAVSELVTNAVRHAPGPCTLEMAAEGARVRIAVSDTSQVLPQARTPQYDGTGGFGVHLLTSIAGGIETDTRADGKSVTVRVTLENRAAAT